jgi:hypothetical protein
MKRVLAIVAVLTALMLATVLTGYAAPDLVSDPAAGVTIYKVSINVPAEADGSLKIDARYAPLGGNSLLISACINDPVWGELCSDPVPFEF